MKDFIDASKISKLVIERDGTMKIWFEKIEDDLWEVSFNRDKKHGEVCSVFGLPTSCNNCIFNKEGCSANRLKVNTEEVLKICFNIGNGKKSLK